MSIKTAIKRAAQALRRDAALAGACGAGFGAAITWLALSARLPQSADFYVPRRPGYGVIELAAAVQSRFALREAMAWASLLLLAAALAAIAWRAWSVVKAKRASPLALAGEAAAALALSKLFHWVMVMALGLIHDVWFTPECADARELLATFLVSGALGAGWGGAVLGWARRDGAAAACWTAPALVVALWGAASYDAAAASLARAAGIRAEARERETVVILTRGRRGPGTEVYETALGGRGADYSQESLETLRAFAARASVFQREALRHLYAARALRLEAEALRDALAQAFAAGDALAGLLLLENLAYAPEGAGKGHLNALSDERWWRVGPRAAAMLATAFAHFGKKEAEAWSLRATDALAPGLAPSAAATPLTGRVRGRVSGPVAMLALYARLAPEAPYSLAPTQLVASQAPGRSGAFEFRGLGPGEYFLAARLKGRLKDVRVSGHRGDIRLATGAMRVELPSIAVTGKKR